MSRRQSLAHHPENHQDRYPTLALVLLLLLLLLVACSQQEPGIELSDTEEPAQQFTPTIEHEPEPEDADYLIAKLAEDDSIANDAEENLIALGEEAVDALIAALEDPNDNIRTRAVYVLGEIGDPKAVEPLKEAFDQGIDEALDALGKLDDSAAVEVAVKASVQKRSSSSDTIESIVQDSGPRVPEVWAHLLDNEDEEFQITVLILMFLNNVGTNMVGNLEPVVIALLKVECCQTGQFEQLRMDVFESMGPPGFDTLIAIFEQRDPELLGPAAYTLANIGGSRALDVLSVALVDEDPIVYGAAQRGLRSWDWENDGEAAIAVLEPAVDQLIEHIGNYDAESDYREDAATLLYRVGGPRAVEGFIAALESSDSNMRGRIVLHLGNIKDPTAIPVLVAMVEDPQEEKRHFAIVALGDIGGTKVVNTLVEVLNDEDPEIVERALETLVNLDDESLAPLLAALSNGNLRKIADRHLFFIRRGEPDSEELLVQALMAHGDVRMASNYLNCGHEPLEEAAKEWAKANGFAVIDAPSFGDGSLKWGK